MWDIAAELPAAVLEFEDLGGAVYVFEVKASESSSLALSCGEDKLVRLWYLRTGGCVRIMDGHTEAVLSVDMDSGCRTAVSGSADTSVKVWDLGSGRCTGTYEGHDKGVEQVFMQESGEAFITGSWEGTSQDRVIAWAAGTRPPVMDVQCSGTGSIYANRDLSQVAAYVKHDDNTHRTKVWK